MSDPYRGYVTIADAILEAARDLTVAVVEQAIDFAVSARSPAPRDRRGWCLDDAITAVVRVACPKSRVAYAYRSAAHRSMMVDVRCACGSLSVVEISDGDLVETTTPASMLLTALGQAGCYCVQPDNRIRWEVHP